MTDHELEALELDLDEAKAALALVEDDLEESAIGSACGCFDATAKQRAEWEDRRAHLVEVVSLLETAIEKEQRERSAELDWV
jgi:hypothetical protein